MRVVKDDSDVMFITKEKQGMTFWLSAFEKSDGNPYVSMGVVGRGHTSVSGRYDQKMTVEELGEFLKYANEAYEKLKHLEKKVDYRLTTKLTTQDFSKHKLNVMGSPWQNSETESSIWWLLKFAIDKGSFEPFNLTELQDYYVEKLSIDDEFRFNKLRNPEDIVRTNEGVVHYTDYFIETCYKLINN